MATESELKHALTVLVDMVQMYAPSLAKSGGWVRAKELVSGAPADGARERLLPLIVADCTRFLEAQEQRDLF